jgi:Cu+-exporting ATPase
MFALEVPLLAPSLPSLERRDGDRRMIEREFSVTGMHCHSCVALISDEVGELHGVATVDVDLSGGRARVRFDPDQVSEAQIVDAIRTAGYGATPLAPGI